MSSSRTTATVCGRVTLVFLPPEVIDELTEEGRARLRPSYIGSDSDYEEEVLEEMGLNGIEVQEPDDSGVSVDACAVDEPDPFYELMGVSRDAPDHDDPHEELLRRIGVLSSKGKW